VHRHRSKFGTWRARRLVAMVCAVATMTVPDLARAQGFLDFLFGGPPQQSSSPPPLPRNNSELSSPPGVGRIAPAPLGPERVREEGGGTGHGVGFCVRLCDGQHFPMEKMANATPAQTCSAICPTSTTKVFFGTDIAGAIASDGARYSDLNTAFLYRKQLVAHCTCNGKDAFGLTTFDVKNDPTLRPGDIVSTKDGLATYNGKAGPSGFTPIEPAALGPQLNSVASGQRAKLPPEPPPQDDEDPGTFVQPPSTTPAVGSRAPANR